MIKKKKKIPQHIKEEVWRIYGSSVCWCCQEQRINAKNKHFGHIIAESKGGLETLDNLRPICQNCNLRMGTENMYDFMLKNGYPMQNVSVIEHVFSNKSIKQRKMLKNKLVFFIPMYQSSQSSSYYDCAIGTKSLFKKHPYLKSLNLRKLFTPSIIEEIHFYFITNVNYYKFVKYKQQKSDMKKVENELKI